MTETLQMARRSSGWQKLPLEVRYMIYRESWESRTVVLHPATQEGTGAKEKLPATLHLSHEARMETLRFYAMLQLNYASPTSADMKTMSRYINSRLDVLLIDGLTDAHRPTLTVDGTIPQHSLHIILGRSIHPSLGTRLFRQSDNLSIVSTFDFWATSTRHGNRRPRPPNMPSVTTRYRICRTRDATKTELATYEDAVWYPEENHNYQCPEPGCGNPTSEWMWKYTPEANTPRTSCPGPDGNDNAFPMPGSRLEIPCAVVRWYESDARKILQREKALLFGIAHDPSPCQWMEWSVLEVVSPNVWAASVIQWALNHLRETHPISEWDPSPRLHTLGPHDDDDFGQDVLPYVNDVFISSGTSLMSGRTVHGVCLPEYQLPEDATGSTSCLVASGDYPAISGELEEELLVHRTTVEDLEREDLFFKEMCHFQGAGLRKGLIGRRNRWHSCH
ncbi:hypothetical protein QBC40DRAFT_301311 [Triangularia verruculosa]|uniref:2EXR domain-containing protein n=1 Tax=Triangularia verruculosa TaxID=2587418 RepID=A0AAN6X9G6_9PEZI|nr:hypothetical protein QBC40DRAFT_301311 [Triangularia verruculosa]